MGQTLDNRYTAALREIVKELTYAKSRFPKDFSTRHEGYAIIKEELDELWDAVKEDNEHGLDVKNAIQTAAMALRYAAEFGNFSKIAPVIERNGTGQLIEQALNAIVNV